MQILPGQVREAEFLRQIFVATPEAGTPVEEVLKDTYWAHVARKLHPADRIEVIPEDGSYFVELYVSHVDLNRVRVVELRQVSLQETVELDATLAEDYEVSWRGTIKRYCVLRKEDRKIIKENFESGRDATIWLQDFVTDLVR